MKNVFYYEKKIKLARARLVNIDIMDGPQLVKYLQETLEMLFDLAEDVVREMDEGK